MKLSLAIFVTMLVLGLSASSSKGSTTLLSGFEGDLSSSAGLNWQTSLAHSFVGDGVTQGSSALQLTHGTGWTQDFILDGGALANLVASNDTFEVDTLTPTTTSWRQMFIVMQGDGQGWSDHQFNLVGNGSGTVSLDLNATGLKANAAAGAKSWWQILLIFQGEDVPATAEVQTIIDNIRFTAIPEPSSFVLCALMASGLVPGYRRRSRIDS